MYLFGRRSWARTKHKQQQTKQITNKHKLIISLSRLSLFLFKTYIATINNNKPAGYITSDNKKYNTICIYLPIYAQSTY